ncbi:hypothetical protein NMY22_g14297 [Coprinellus aureogranulatus]|nr:hypothetical protein NMY22_g14297 [Coprinellus aureogranulatus]
MAFRNARNFTIDAFHSTINHHASYYPPPSRDPIAILDAARAVEATHTSRTAAYAPKCKPGTRVKIIQDIVAWAEWMAHAPVPADPKSKPASMLWFQGPAGGGKTCIMREVSTCLSKAGLLAGTYFFSSRVAGLSTESPFIATVVHQLLIAAPHLKPYIFQVLTNRPAIFSESLETQTDKLILGPPAKEYEQAARHKLVMVIDGFDECVVTERGHLLQILYKIATESPRFLIIVASRPEFDIRTTFNSANYKAITHFLRLQDYDGTSDIRNYFCDEFCRIRDNHPAKTSIPAMWPTEYVLQTLIEKSSGNFIVSSTVIKYVDNPRRNPTALLQDVVSLFAASPTITNTNPLADLDALYTMILHPPEGDVSTIKRILHCLMGILEGDPPAKSWQISRSPAFFDQLLDLEPGTTDITLCDVHSILNVPAKSDTSDMGFHHSTLTDYLRSPSRSADLFQSKFATHVDLACLCAQRLEAWSKDATATSPVATYAAEQWMVHLDRAVQRQNQTPNQLLWTSYTGQTCKWQCPRASLTSVAINRRASRVSLDDIPTLAELLLPLMSLKSDSELVAQEALNSRKIHEDSLSAL